MNNVVSLFRIGFRIVAFLFAVGATILSLATSARVNSPHLQRLRITGIDHVQVVDSGSRNRSDIEIAYVNYEPVDDSNSAERQDDQASALEYGTFNGKAEDLVGTELWADMGTDPPSPIGPSAAGVAVLVILAAGAMMFNVAPAKRENEGSFKWRGNRWDLFLGAVVMLCLLPLYLSSWADASLSDLRRTVVGGQIAGIVVAIYAAVTLVITAWRAWQSGSLGLRD